MADLHKDRRRANVFGEAADQYDRARPTYPAELIDWLLVDEPRRVLDVGCGTGKAGRLFAARGCDVLGVEPDPRMAAVARGHGLPVEVATFEEWDPAGRSFDLLVSSQAWHWVDPTVGLLRAAAVLRSGGRFAVCWNLFQHNAQASQAFADVYDGLGLDMRDSVALGTYRRDGGSGTLSELEANGAFSGSEVRRYFWEQRFSRDEWLDQLPTHSDHRILPPEKLEGVLRGVGAAIDAMGGSMLVRYDTMLVTALRIDH